jgi:hypothetical protein
LFHLVNIVKITDQVDSAETFARSHFPTANFLNEADITALVTPSLVNRWWVQSHPRKPDTVPQLVGSDELLRHFAIFTAVKEALIGSEIFNESAGRDEAVITQVDLPETVATLMADMTRHVHPKQQAINRVDTCDLVISEKPTNPVGKDQQLFPTRTRLVGRTGDCPVEPLLNGDEVFALKDFKGQLFRLGADLWQLNEAFGDVAVNFVAPTVTQVLRRRFIVRAGLKKEVNDDEPEP